MQPLIAAGRSHLTAAQVIAILRDTPAVEVASGCELLDQGLNVLDDLSDLLEGGSVTRNSYADLHGSAALALEAALDWGTAIVRPWMSLSDGTSTARFNLGAYYTTTDEVELEDDPAVRGVECLDILDALNNPTGESYAVGKGARYLAAVQEILASQGYSQVVVDTAAANAILPSARVWPLDESTTWLQVVNDLLGSIGYQGIWSDWDGRLRVQPYTSPSSRAPEWSYDAELATSMLTPKGSIKRDFYRAPNRWVFYRANNVDGPTPVEGDGIYTYTNESTGPTSVQARGGRTITRPVPLDVADHASLVAASQITIDADLRLKTTLTRGTSPNPLHWHFDRIAVNDPKVGRAVDVLAPSWTLPLNGDDMTHEWAVL